MTPARFRWGLLFVTLGLLLLMRNTGVLNDDFWIDLVIYFPIILIAIGIEKIFTKTRYQFISYATSVVLLLSGLGIAYYSGSDGSDSSFFRETRHRISDDGEFELIKARLDLGETNLTIRDSGKDIIYGRFDRYTRKPEITHLVDGQVALVEYDQRSSSLLGGVVRIDSDGDQDWNVKFSENIPLELDCRSEYSDLHLNLSTTPLKSLNIDADDTRIYLKLGELEKLVNVIVTGEESDFKLRLPSTVGLQVRGTDYENYLERLGLIEDDGDFFTEGFDTLPVKVTLDIDNDLSSFSVDFF